MKNFNYLFLLFLLFLSTHLKAQNNALNFEGNDNYVQMNSSFENQNAFDGGFTIEFWIKTDNVTEAVVMSKWNESTENGTFKIEMTSEGKIAFTCNTPNNSPNGGQQRIESDEIIAGNGWHHVTISKEESIFFSYLYMYVNAERQSNYLFLFDNLTNTTHPLYLGRDASGTLPFFNGELDELRIWDEFRSCPNIFANMFNQQFPPPNNNAANPIVQHSFNQGIAGGNNNSPNPISSLVDSSSNGNNGTLVDFALTGSTSNFITATNGVNDAGFTFAAEINVRQSGGKTIRNGDTIPSLEDGTDFGIVYGNGDDERYYSVENLGIENLNLSTISSSNPAFEIIANIPPSISLTACEGFEFTIRFISSGIGEQESIITIESNDPNEADYTFKVKAKAGPQINLTGNTDFGILNKCDIAREIYTIENTGGEVLEIYGDIQISGNSAFKVTRQPAATVPIGSSTTFEIEYSPTQVGLQNATVYISSNSIPYSFSIEGTANAATYPDYEWKSVGQEGFSAENTDFHSLKIANGGTPYIAFQEGTTQRTRVMRFNGASWRDVGTLPTTTQTSYQSLVIDNENNLYVAYQNGAANNQTVILKYDGTNWITLGNNISGDNNSYQKLAIDEAGNLYIAFRNTTGKAKVMTYNSSTNQWENVGTDETGFSEGDVSYIDITISVDNSPFVVFKDQANSNPNDQGARVMYFENNVWNDYANLPNATNNGLQPTETHIALNIYEDLFVALQDNSSDVGQVYYYGEGWSSLGSVSSGSSVIGNIVIGLDGAVYLCFKDEENGNTATIVTYTEGWTSFGNLEDENIAIENIHLAIDKNGILYVAFSDTGNGGKTTVKRFIPSDAKPIIRAQGNNTNITNGNTTPIRANDTDFGNIYISTPRTINYTIINNGNLNLDIFEINLTNNPTNEFAITSSTPATIPPSEALTFSVTFTPTGNGLRTATIEIVNGDCDKPLYRFNVQANGMINPPTIEVSKNSTIINDGGSSNFGTVITCGNGNTKTYTITNRGSDGLDIASITSSSTPDFVVSGFTPSVLNFNQSTTFSVTFNSLSMTTIDSEIEIGYTSINPSLFTFEVVGASLGPDTEAPVLIPMQNFLRTTDSTNCFYTNQSTSTSQSIPNGVASDACNVSYNYVLSGATNINNAPSLQGIRFNRGITTVRWTARDDSDNVSLPNEFTVRVRDAQPPIIQAPADIVSTTDLYSCEANSTGIDLGMPIVSDNCLARTFNDAPAIFPLGETIVLWTAIDSAGNTATAEQLVTITEQFFVIPSDSLILVDIYNQTGGQNWIRSWDLNSPVSTWNGISVRCGEVMIVDLSNNNLSGTLPNSVLNFAQVNNPNFSLRIGGNRLSFDSAEDFVGRISNFIYLPQAKIYAPLRRVITEGESITFSAATEGDFNSYQWYKNQILINGATSPTFTITNALISDAGVYVCQIKNSVATQLTLERHPITLTVEGFLNPTDSIALVRIFEQTGGLTSWISPWDLTQRVATWEGVTLSGNKLIELDLSSRNMIGRLPEVFDAELFSELRYLSFFDNNLEGQIPATIGTISTLTYLDLDKNNFEGAVPASFGNLQNLQALWLSRNKLTQLPNEIGNLRSLRNLYLNDNEFIRLPETIGNLSELLVLNISDNGLVGFPNSITNLQNLIEFYANRNFIAALPIGMENLTRLIIFEINANDLVSLTTNLLAINSLKELRVAENNLEFDDLLPFLNGNFVVFDYAPQAPINEEMDILATTNSTVTFTITTEGNGNNYQWLKDENPISTFQNFTINRVQSSDAGLYTALITNPSLPNLILQRRSIRLNVECQAGLNFEIQEPEQTTFCEGQPFGLKLEINDEFIPTSQIRWRKDGIIVAFANEKNYTVTQAGTYTAEILTSNGCTAISNQIEIRSVPQPQINIELINNETLTSTLTSEEEITYQWLKDGNPIANAFENSYTPTQTGEYSLLILTESGCSAVSETIIFTADGITGIEEPKELRNLAIFPNPNNGNFFIDFGIYAPNGEPTFILIDAIGRKINLKTDKISSTRYTTKTTNLAGGIYSLQIQTKDGLAFRKFVIEE